MKRKLLALKQGKNQLDEGVPVWTEDLSDDCSDDRHGLILRDEKMDTHYSWSAWALAQPHDLDIACSNYKRSERCSTGFHGRASAERAARKFLDSAEYIGQILR